MALVDTSAIIDVGKGKKQALNVLEDIEKRGEKLRISTISIFELCAGSPPGMDEKTSKLLEPLQIIPLFNEHAKKAGIIYKTLKNKGHDIGPIDSLIAAVALSEKEELVTSNVKHFKRVDELKVSTY